MDQQLLDQNNLLHRITNRIRRSLELQEILTTTVAEVRSFLRTDRVKVYRFHADGHGQVIAESVQPDRLPSLLGLNFPADDIPPQARELFLTARQRSIVDLASQQIGFSPLHDPETQLALETSDIRYRPVDPCHAEYLQAMGVQSSVVVPILQGEELWGLLVSHHAEPRQFSDEDLQFLQLIVDQVSIAITQATLLSQIRSQAQQQTSINRIAMLLHAVPTMQFQVALEAAVTTLHGSGGRLYLLPAASEPPQLYTCGRQPTPPHPEQPLLESTYLWQQYFYRLQQQPLPDSSSDLLPWTIHDLYQVPECRTLAAWFEETPIRGILISPLIYGPTLVGCFTVFRDERNIETVWAGYHIPDARQRMPRQSFAAWRELKKGQAQDWTPADQQLAQILSRHFSMAAQQSRLYCQIHTLNTNLEAQVRERTLALEHTIEQQKTLASVVAKIRESLDLDAIFRTAVQEVRQLLNADRVGVFRFDPTSNWNDGEFVAEDVVPAFSSVLGLTIHDRHFGEYYAKRYRQGAVQAVADIYQAGFSDCHLQVLAKFQIQANLVVPLLKGDTLWGLLCIHQCAQPRQWTASEIEFIQQIAIQLGIAIQQAELFVQTRQQAQQLTLTLQDLKKAQSQLVQTEKMSSLGQLVAGVAHEINNPVNFIYGNLDYANTYAQDLLHLIQLYQSQSAISPELQAKIAATDLDFIAEDFPKILASMKIGADRIRQIVQSLRNFSRLDQAEKKPVDLHEGIDSTLLILQHRLKSNGKFSGIEIIRDYGNLPLVECYAGQLNQVLMNILSNAIDALENYDAKRTELPDPDATPCPNQIRISTRLLPATRQKSKRVQICIADNGGGMSEAVQKRIFDPFFTTKPIGKGTGLGLSISYQVITEKHRGKLWCVSEVGKGTEFWIELPLN
ncbi:MAG: GAF domain-containing protein [Synechococcales cyanobacterium C42_A2020_086]|jgi:GAF domain-containing protein|nr:GAF domain-containing protein [Synechococcales cyanobacterium C42_A2020_086]